MIAWIKCRIFGWHSWRYGAALTAEDRKRLGEFDELMSGWSDEQRAFRLYKWCAFLRRLVDLDGHCRICGIPVWTSAGK